MLFVQALRQIRESDGDATLVVETPTKGGGKGSSVSVTVTLCCSMGRTCTYTGEG